jgi:pimeloyl-ACP methyl ester carboxylesterase
MSEKTRAAVTNTNAVTGTTGGAKPSTYVLVHGAWHGGWCWDAVARILRSHGHRVFTPTLSGLGERAHLLSPEIDLQVFVQDVVDVFERHDLSEVILVGHSFGGTTLIGAADRVPQRIRQLVFLDAVVRGSLLRSSPRARSWRWKPATG